MSRRMDAGMIALALAAALSTTLGQGSPVRAVLVLTAFLLVPGWALVSLLPLGPPAAMLGLAIGLSIAVGVAGSLVMVWLGRFDVVALTAIVGGLSVAQLIVHLVRQPLVPADEAPAPWAAR